ncbi:MAG: NUDIX hydrolase [Pirellulales bacterium]
MNAPVRPDPHARNPALPPGPRPEEKHLLTTSRFTVHEVEYTTGDGHTVRKQVIRHPGSVVILPMWDDDRVCLIRNYRPAAGRQLIELPAGTLEPGEEHDATAARELTEETGLTASHWRTLSAFYAAPGILDEHMHLYLATGLTEGAPHRETGEEIENLIVPFAQALEWVRSGEICDAKTIIGLLYYDCFRKTW